MSLPMNSLITFIASFETRFQQILADTFRNKMSRNAQQSGTQFTRWNPNFAAMKMYIEHGNS